MTRDAIINWLSVLLDHEPNHTWPDGPAAGNALRAAIAYMQPPSDAEVAAAREPDVACNSPHYPLFLRALDALAREPGLHAEIECLSRGLCASTDGCVEYQRAIAALEARLARVREVAGALLDALDRCQQPYEHEVRRKELRAALTADAGPEVKP